MNNFRIGFGYDVHQITENRKMFLGGVEIPYTKGFFGHSDADILLHAVCDALLGALALGDIGKHFPDTDKNYEGYDSKNFVKKVFELIKTEGYGLGNLDCTIILQKPKIAPFINDMVKTIAELLESDISQVSIKATTPEKMGFNGREEGAEAYAVVLLYKE
ncbi:MAG: 2-C-methyl-D-erythritol 2,4-cyclodiphosphate synthase [bacterium]